jgi:hypothetical protein
MSKRHSFIGGVFHPSSFILHPSVDSGSMNSSYRNLLEAGSLEHYRQVPRQKLAQSR